MLLFRPQRGGDLSLQSQLVEKGGLSLQGQCLFSLPAASLLEKGIGNSDGLEGKKKRVKSWVRLVSYYPIYPFYFSAL